jgi:folate-binding protein YgfZ
MPIAKLENRACLRLSGPEVRSFLQGLITQDIEKLTPATPVYAAVLTPQGKYLHDFFLIEQEDGIYLDGERARLADLERRLMMYRLRAKVEIENIADEFDVYALWGEPAEDRAGAYQDPRLDALGKRLIHPKGDAAPEGLVSADDYDRHRLSLGVPDGSKDIEVEKTLILEANIDLLNGVSFTKGCYVGQELTARMKYRGKVRRRLIPVTVDGPLPAPGSAISHDGKNIGDIRSGREDRALAYLRIEDLEKAPFQSGEATLKPEIPDWLTLED